MAGDWIKMRGNLWDDPRVSKLCDLCECGEAQIVGALYWLWATADQHSSDGCMPGLTLRQIDRKTGVAGFGAALCEVGWLVNDTQGVVISKFEEHNGESAKKRCQTAKRVAKHKAANAEVTHQALPDERTSVSTALPREEKRRDTANAVSPPSPQGEGEGVEPPVVIGHHGKDPAEGPVSLASLIGSDDSPAAAVTPTQAGLICRAIRRAGVADANPSSPLLLELIAAGATEEEFAHHARQAARAEGGAKGFAWVLGAVKGERMRAKAAAGLIAHGAMPPPSRASPTAYERTQAARQATADEWLGQSAAGAAARAAESGRRQPQNMEQPNDDIPGLRLIAG